jgi:hypothetical protein
MMWKQRDVELEAVLKKFYHEQHFIVKETARRLKNPALEVTPLRTLTVS